MEVKAKGLKPNVPVKVKSIIIKDNGKKSFSEKKPAFFIMDEMNNKWIIELRDGEEVGRWNMDYILYTEWL